jgi:hypothetical protein
MAKTKGVLMEQFDQVTGKKREKRIMLP